MKIRFRADDSDGADRDLGLLYTWLRDDRTLRGLVELELIDHRAQPGEMGVAFETVMAVVSAGAALVSAGAAVGQLAASIKEWRTAREPRSRIVVIYDGDQKDVQAIIDALSDARSKE